MSSNAALERRPSATARIGPALLRRRTAAGRSGRRTQISYRTTSPLSHSGQVSAGAERLAPHRRHSSTTSERRDSRSRRFNGPSMVTGGRRRECSPGTRPRSPDRRRGRTRSERLETGSHFHRAGSRPGVMIASSWCGVEGGRLVRQYRESRVDSTYKPANRGGSGTRGRRRYEGESSIHVVPENCGGSNRPP